MEIQLQPNNFEIYYQRALIVRHQNPKWAIQDLSKATLIDNTYYNVKSFLLRAQIYEEQDHILSAILDYEHGSHSFLHVRIPNLY